MTSQVILFWRVGCRHCQLWLKHMDQPFHLITEGVTFRKVWIKSGDPLVERYKKEIEGLGTPLIVIEDYVNNKFLSLGVAGMTTEQYAEGFMRALRNNLGRPEPNVQKYL